MLLMVSVGECILEAVQAWSTPKSHARRTCLYSYAPQPEQSRRRRRRLPPIRQWLQQQVQAVLSVRSYSTLLVEAATVLAPPATTSSSAPLLNEHDTQQCRPPDLSVLVPFDLVLDEAPTRAFAKLWHHFDQDAEPLSLTRSERRALAPFAASHQVALTAVGVKGSDQAVNQDRGFVSGSAGGTMLGVLDGHGLTGHNVAEYAYQALIQGWHDDERRLDHFAVVDKLEELFVRVDQSLSPDLAHHGGATVSIILQPPLSRRIYLANSGDSQSMIAAVVTPPPTKNSGQSRTMVLQKNALQVPDDPDEAARVVAAGGRITPATEHDVARVAYKVISQDAETGEFYEQEFGVAMTRGMGDWGATGVISNPVIQSYTVGYLKRQAIQQYLAQSTENNDESSQEPSDVDDKKWNVQLFGVSVSDGLLDYVDADYIASIMALGLFPGVRHVLGDDAGNRVVRRLSQAPAQYQPLMAANHLLHVAAQQWHSDTGGDYRDDITLAASKLDSGD
jgi:Protein phosphatase 2C